MLVKARVTEAVVVVMVPQVGNNVIFQPAVGGPYTLIAHVSRTICLPVVEGLRGGAVSRRACIVGRRRSEGSPEPASRPLRFCCPRPRFCCGVRFVSGSFVWLCGVGLISARARDFIEVGARRGLWAFARKSSDTF